MNNTMTQQISDSQLGQFNELAHKFNQFGLNLLIFDTQQRCVLQRDAGQFQSDAARIAEWVGQRPAEEFDPASAAWVSETLLVCPVKINRSVVAVMAVDTGPAAYEKTPQEKIYLACIVEDFNRNMATAEQVPQQIEKFSNELSRAYEEIVLLYNLSTNMQVTQSSSSYLQMACDQLTQLVQVEGIAIFVEREVDGHKQTALAAGSGVMSIDSAQADILHTVPSEYHLFILRGTRYAEVFSVQICRTPRRTSTQSTRDCSGFIAAPNRSGSGHPAD